MNTIKVFLASSIKEFSKEWQTLMAFFQTFIIVSEDDERGQRTFP